MANHKKTANGALPPALETLRHELDEAAEKLDDYAKLERENERLDDEVRSLTKQIARLKAKKNGKNVGGR